MQIIPAIDMRNGKCVRLTQGDYAQEIIYDDNPSNVAKQFEKEGATMLHIVDLDGAKEGSVSNLKSIQDIVKTIAIPIEVGGGIRDEKTVKQLLDLGVARVILGTVVLENEIILKKILNKYAQNIAVALDSRNGILMKKGWLESGDVSTLTYAQKLEKIGVQRFIFTDIMKDGMLTEPNYQEINTLVSTLSVPVIASGGISTLHAVKKLKKIGVEGVILGKALYEKKISLQEVLRVN